MAISEGKEQENEIEFRAKIKKRWNQIRKKIALSKDQKMQR